jgi:hypothetical protein
MDIEFHYYMVYRLAQGAGFDDEESYVIAYSSQYVDDNSRRCEISGDQSEVYKNYISQTMDILKPRKRLMRIYPCFHFIPGDYDADSARRKDGKLHILNTTPNSPNANTLMDKALASKNLYRIGICTHSYADTWAHQNFVGYFDYFNGLGGVLEKITPNVGHADAGHQPDIPGLVWKDKRLISDLQEVHNTPRFMEAAEFIFKRFKKYKNPKAPKGKVEAEWRKLKAELERAIGEEFKGRDRSRKRRIGNYTGLIRNFKEYDENEWFDNAVETKRRGLKDRRNWGPFNRLNVLPDKYYQKDDFENSHWFRFQEAVKEHQKVANEMYFELYHQLEVEEY